MAPPPFRPFAAAPYSAGFAGKGLLSSDKIFLLPLYHTGSSAARPGIWDPESVFPLSNRDDLPVSAVDPGDRPTPVIPPKTHKKEPFRRRLASERLLFRLRGRDLNRTTSQNGGGEYGGISDSGRSFAKLCPVGSGFGYGSVFEVVEHGIRRVFRDRHIGDERVEAQVEHGTLEINLNGIPLCRFRKRF